MKHFKVVILLLFFLSLAAGWLYSYNSPVTTFEEAVVAADLKEAGPQWQAALVQYPDAAPRVFALYGHTPEFAEVLRRYGHNQVVPIIDKCLEGGDDFLEIADRFDQVVDSLMQLKRPAPTSLTPEECGWKVILLTQTIGNDFLGRFTVDDAGKAHRLPGSSIAAALKNAATSGLQNMEKKLVRGDEVGWRDWGSAALDVALVGTAGKVGVGLLKHRLINETAKVGVSAKLGVVKTGLVDFAKAAAPRVAKYATIVGVGYLAVYHPQVITAAGRTAAEVLGLPPLVGASVLWGVVLFVPLFFLVNALQLMMSLYRGVRSSFAKAKV